MLGVLQRFAILLVGLVATLLVAEGLTRLLSEVRPSITERDPRIGRRYVPGLEDEIFVGESEQRVRLRFNDEGFRGPNRNKKKPRGTCRVAVLGDSQIAAIATQEEDTLVRRLEARLQSASASDWEVMNFGVSGSSTAQELVLYREVVSAYDPDVVILAYFEGNDLVDNSDRMTRAARIYMDFDENGKLFQKSIPSAVVRSSSWLNRNSRFYVWQKDQLNQAIHNVLDEDGLGIRIGRTFLADNDENLRHAWKLTEILIREFRSEVVEQGSAFLFVNIPAAETVDDTLWAKRLADVASPEEYDRDRARERLASITRRHGIDAVHPTIEFREHLRSSPDTTSEGWLYFKRVGHLNENGQQLLADIVYRELADSGTLYRVEQACGTAAPPTD